MPDIDFHSRYRSSVNAVIFELEREARPPYHAVGFIFPVFIRPSVRGPDANGRLIYFNTDQDVIDRLRERRIPFRLHEQRKPARAA